MVKIVDTLEVKIQYAILTAIDNFITPRIELAVTLINVSYGRDTANVTANSECGERIGITASFEKVSEKNNTFHELNMNDETRGYIPDEGSELSVPKTCSDWRSHTHHRHYWRLFGKKPAIVFNLLEKCVTIKPHW